MRRLLLLVSAMLVMTGMMAQDVYSSGYYTQDGVKKAAVYKNNTMLYSSTVSELNSIATSVVVSHVNDDVYWVRSNESYGDVMKNGELFLNQNSGTYIHSLAWIPGMSPVNGNPEYSLRAAGYQKIDGVKYAAIWKGSNSTPYCTPNSGNGCASEAYGVTMAHDASGNAWNVYYCGYVQATAGSNPRATVWIGNNQLYTMSQVDSYAYGLDYYAGNIYTVGVEVINGKYVTKVWKNDQELYTLTDATQNSRGWKIKVYGDDVWVCGWGTLRTQCIWKNGQPYYTYTASNTRDMSVNSKGVYHGVTRSVSDVYTSFIYKDGVELYQVDNCEYIYGIYMKDECLDEDVRDIPYEEHFEMGATDWACWTTKDIEDNDGYASYWQLSDILNPDFDYSAVFKYDPNNDQEGWLISPRISLQEVTSAILQFYTYEEYPNDMQYEGVLISTTGTSASDFHEIWTQEAPAAEWNHYTLDISEFAGNDIYVAFKYTGLNGHTWYVDDVYIDGNLSIGEEVKNAVTVYPNPANDVLYINGIEKYTEVSIYNAIGALVKVVSVNGNEAINVSELAAGLYIARFGENSVRFTKK